MNILIYFAEVLGVIAATVTAFSVLYVKFVKPVKKVVKQVEENTKQLNNLDDKIAKVRADRAGDNEFNVEIRAIILESLIAVLDGLEQVGANHTVTIQKKKLISFLSKHTGSKYQ